MIPNPWESSASITAPVADELRPLVESAWETCHAFVKELHALGIEAGVQIVVQLGIDIRVPTDTTTEPTVPYRIAEN